MRCVFLPRHGRGHPPSPTHLNYRANIDALKRSGVTDVLSLSAVGSLKAELPPGHFVIVDQFIDRSFAREKSFFGEGIVAHVSMAHPVCSRLGDALEAAARALGLPVTRGGTYLVMEGPQFSTKAESELYRSWGCSVIGMTNMPEAKLAREAELNYATVAMVTDFDCWHPDHDHVTVEAVVRVLLDNADKARALVQRVVPEIGKPREPARRAAIMRWTTRSSPRRHMRDPQLVAKLDAVAGRVLLPSPARRNDSHHEVHWLGDLAPEYMRPRTTLSALSRGVTKRAVAARQKISSLTHTESSPFLARASGVTHRFLE